MRKQKATQLKQARQAVLSGLVEIGLPVLRELAGAGDESACASLAELLAFLGDWQECIPKVGKCIGNPFVVYAGNVFDDMVRLLARAGRETRDWKTIGDLAEAASNHIERRLCINDMKYSVVKTQMQRNRLTAILGRLKQLAANQGHSIGDLIHLHTPLDQRSETAYLAAIKAKENQRPSRLMD